MKKLAYVLSLIVSIYGCKDTTDDLGNNSNGGNQDPPVAVLLVFPHEDDLCNEGSDFTPTESTVYFEWEPNDNGESYSLIVENLSTGSIVQYETEDFIFPVTIQRAVAFRWYVEYNYQEETRTSTIWNFYNAGPGVQTYAPFPAEIISPTMAETIGNTNSITLQWTGSDVDNDIVSYDVYFGVNNPPNINATGITSNQITQSVVPGTIYYWNIITKDAEGNSSDSGLYQFNISE